VLLKNGREIESEAAHFRARAAGGGLEPVGQDAEAEVLADVEALGPSRTPNFM
jgi:hypothetical protein